MVGTTALTASPVLPPLLRFPMSIATDTTDRPLVLIVDDDEEMRSALRELLLSVGLDACCFGSTQELLHADLPERPGCLILDVRMPGASGLDLQQHLTLNGNTRPIIFLTGHGDIAMTVQAMKAGAVDFLTKPVRDQTLLDAVTAAIEKGAAWDVEFRIANLDGSVRWVMGKGEVLRDEAGRPVRLLGVNVDATIALTFVMGAALAAVAGLMFMIYYGVVHFNDGFTPGVKAFTAAVLGGIGSLPGAVLGGLLIGLIETFWSAYFSIDYKDVATFSILAITLIFLPSGLLGKPEVEKV